MRLLRLRPSPVPLCSACVVPFSSAASPVQRPVLGPCNTSHLQARLNVQGGAPAPAGGPGSIAPAGARLTLNWRSVAVVPLVGREVSRSRRTSHVCRAQDCHPASPAFPAIPPPARDCATHTAALPAPPAHPPHLPCTPMALGFARAPRTTQASVEGSAAALGAASELLGGRRQRRQTLLRRRRAAVLPAASFDLGSFNFNPTDWLKVPRDQTGITLYPWMAHSMREMAMRRWLQKEVRWVGRGQERRRRDWIANRVASPDHTPHLFAAGQSRWTDLLDAWSVLPPRGWAAALAHASPVLTPAPCLPPFPCSCA